MKGLKTFVNQLLSQFLRSPILIVSYQMLYDVLSFPIFLSIFQSQSSSISPENIWYTHQKLPQYFALNLILFHAENINLCRYRKSPILEVNLISSIFSLIKQTDRYFIKYELYVDSLKVSSISLTSAMQLPYFQRYTGWVISTMHPIVLARNYCSIYGLKVAFIAISAIVLDTRYMDNLQNKLFGFINKALNQLYLDFNKQ